STNRLQATRLAPKDKSVRLAMTSLKIKQKELAAARRRLWGGVFKGASGDAAGPAPGRQHVESAAARARGDPGIWTEGDQNKKPGWDGWYLVVAVGVGVLAFAAAGFFAATTLGQNRE
ncbi:unnamed protein product, partial [Laminaria digitata]